MEEFALCIEYILLNRDQTIIPGLGTFVVHQQEARYDTQEEIFLPPLRVVQYLQQEDYGKSSSFVSCLMQIYNLNQVKAEEKLNLWVTDFYQQLEDCGFMDLGCIGSFSMDENHTLSFKSSISGITSPAFYALDTFHIKTLAPIEQEEVKKTKKTSITTSEGSIIIRLNRKVMKYAAVAVTIIAMTFSFAVPVENATELGAQSAQQSMLFVPANLANLTCQQEPQQKKEILLQQETVVQPKQEPSTQPAATVTEVKAEVEETTKPAATEEHYCIVLASAISKKNATNYAKVLKERGFASARVLEGKMTRVVIGHYTSEEEARAASSEIQEKSSEFKGAWILKQK